MNDIGTFTKNAQECRRFGQIIVAKGFKKSFKCKKSPTLVALRVTDDPVPDTKTPAFSYIRLYQIDLGIAQAF